MAAENTTHEQRGGVFIGRSRLSGFNATWPFATIVIALEVIYIKATPISAPITLSRQEIIACSEYGIFSTGVRFQHASPQYKPLLVFWCNAPKLLHILESYGYPIASK